MSKKNEREDLFSYKMTDPDSGHDVRVYGLSLPSLKPAFSLLHQLRDDLKLSDCVLTMQKYPILAIKKVNTRKKDSDGNYVMQDKIEEVKSDRRRVLSFDFVTEDVAAARKMEWLYYDAGWPGEIAITAIRDDMGIDKESGEIISKSDVIERGSSNTAASAEDGNHLFECCISCAERPSEDASSTSVICAFEDLFSECIVELPSDIVEAIKSRSAAGREEE